MLASKTCRPTWEVLGLPGVDNFLTLLRPKNINNSDLSGADDLIQLPLIRLVTALVYLRFHQGFRLSNLFGFLKICNIFCKFSCYRRSMQQNASAFLRITLKSCLSDKASTKVIDAKSSDIFTCVAA